MSAGAQRRRDGRKKHAELDPAVRRRGVVDLLATGMARAILRQSRPGAGDGAPISVVDSTASAAMDAYGSLFR